MIKILPFFLLLFSINIVTAQTSRPKQLQKLETRIDFEYLTFSDAARTAGRSDLQQFNQTLKPALKASSPTALSVSDLGGTHYKNGISQYFNSPQTGLVEKFTGIETDFQYLSSAENTAAVQFTLNSQVFRLELSTDEAFVVPIGKHDFAAFHLIKVSKDVTPCSLQEIFDEFYNKNNQNWTKKCFDAGSPELKTTAE